MSLTFKRESGEQTESPTHRVDSTGGRPVADDSATTGGAIAGKFSRRKILLGGLIAAGVLLVLVAGGALMEDFGSPSQPLIFYTVVRGDLSITVTERGNLESQNNVDIICEVDDINGDGIHGTPILSIVPNGSPVVKGELLIQLDSANHRERVDRQIVGTEKARSEQIQAKAKYENQITQKETANAEAELQVQLAKLDLEMLDEQEIENGEDENRQEQPDTNEKTETDPA